MGVRGKRDTSSFVLFVIIYVLAITDPVLKGKRENGDKGGEERHRVTFDRLRRSTFPSVAS